MKTLMEISGLRKDYREDFSLGPLSFSIHESEVLALLGPNGAGKTTCLNMITGLLKGESGSCIFTDPGEESWIRRIGYMSEELSIWPDLCCGEQIDFIAKLYDCDNDYAFRLAGQLGLGSYFNIPGSNLSQGNRRKLSLVLSAVHDPQLLILDEPFNGLDALGRRETSKWLKARVQPSGSGRPRAVLISSHQLEEIENCADRVLIMRSGKIVREYVPEENGRSLPDVYHELFYREENG